MLKPNIRDEEKPKIIIFNTEVKKTYVYYYNKGFLVHQFPVVLYISSFMTLMMTMVLWT